MPSLSIDVPEIKACGMPISGTLEFQPGDNPGTVEFDFRPVENECPGTVEYVWQFGDAVTQTTLEPRSLHRYAATGTYAARMTPRCVRKSSTCEAPAIGTTISIGR